MSDVIWCDKSILSHPSTKKTPTNHEKKAQEGDLEVAEAEEL